MKNVVKVVFSDESDIDYKQSIQSCDQLLTSRKVCDKHNFCQFKTKDA